MHHLDPRCERARRVRLRLAMPRSRDDALDTSHRPLLLSRTCEADVQRGESRDAQRSQQEEAIRAVRPELAECAQEGAKDASK